MKALSQSAQVDQKAHNLIIQALPQLRVLDSAVYASDGRGLKADLTNMLVSSFKGRTLDSKTIQSLIRLAQDPQVDQQVLLGIFNALQQREQKQEGWLIDLLHVQMLRRGPDAQIPSGNSSVSPDMSDPRVTPAILNFIRDRNVPDDRVITFLRGYLAGKPKHRFFKEAAIKVGRIKIEPGRKYNPRDDWDDPEHPTRMSSGNTQPIVEPTSNDLSQRRSLSLLSQLGIREYKEPVNASEKAALSKSMPADWKKALTFPVLRKDKSTKPTDLEEYLTENWRAPCVAASALLYEKDSSGIQTCLESLKTVAAKQYATEKQRFNIVETKGGYMSYMRSNVDYSEDQYSAIDAAMFSLVNAPQDNSRLQIPPSTVFHVELDYFRPLLVALLKGPDVEIRRAAIFALDSGNTYTATDNDRLYVPQVIPLLKDTDPTVREYTLRYLRSKLGRELSSTSELVLKNDGYSSKGGRSTTFLGGGYLIQFNPGRDEHYLPHLKIEPSLRQNDHYMKLVEAVNGSRRDPQPKVRQVATSALAIAATNFTKDSLLEILQDSSPKIRVNAVRGLCLLGEGMLTPIVNTLVDRAEEVRIQATTCLAAWVKYDQVNDQRIAPALIPVLNKQPQIILETLEVLNDRGQLTLDEMQARQAIPILLKISKNSNDSNSSQISAIRVLKAIYAKLPANKAKEDGNYLYLNLQGSLLAGIGLTSLILLFSSLRLRNPFPLMWTGYLIFPEEIVAELMALKQRRQAEKVAPRRIRLELAYEVLLLFWAVHVQIRIDNLNLPPGGNDRAK